MLNLTKTFKLNLSEGEECLVGKTINDYILCVNTLIKLSDTGVDILHSFTTKDFEAPLPSALKCQALRQASSIIRKYRKECRKAVLSTRHGKNKIAPKMPALRKPCFYVNNQNFKIEDGFISFPVWKGFSQRIKLKALIPEEEAFSDEKLGTLRIVVKNNKFLAQITYQEKENVSSSTKVMGVDVGIKCPAVSFTDGDVKFYGNGRKNKYMRRQARYLRKKLQQKKKLNAVKRIDDKESRRMKDIDHKISRAIVNEAIKQGVGIIKLEDLEGISKTTRASRKNNHSLHSWSFARLLSFIEYKAARAGITVIYVNPRYTSQTCPVCGKKNHAQDRQYRCECGFHSHRDIVGSINIASAPVGGRKTRQAA